MVGVAVGTRVAVVVSVRVGEGVLLGVAVGTRVAVAVGVRVGEGVGVRVLVAIGGNVPGEWFFKARGR
jgi:hypothetical protein